MKKKSIFWKTSTWVVIYAIAAFLAMAIQSIICLALKYNFHYHGVVFADFLNGNLVMPISNIGWLWCSICAAYCGVDRACFAIKTANLESGKMDVGDPSKIRMVIILAGLLAVFACLANGFVDAEFDLNAWSSAFGSSVLLYVTGMKACHATQFVNGKLDSDGDGIADEEQAKDQEGNLIFGQQKSLKEKIEEIENNPEASKDDIIKILKAYTSDSTTK